MLTRAAAYHAASTPDKSSTEDRKRKRDILSCLDCRRRKLKCDRAYPACARCVKGGIAASCNYKGSLPGREGHHDEFDASPDEGERAQKRARNPSDSRPPNVAIGREGVPGSLMHSTLASPQSQVINSLENRLVVLESMLVQTSTRLSRVEGSRSAPPTMISKYETRGSKEPETNLFKGLGVRTQFYGPSNPTSLLAHVGLLSRRCSAREAC